MEDYDDERDDAKFYRGAALYQRKKDYEVEKEMDAKVSVVRLVRKLCYEAKD